MLARRFKFRYLAVGVLITLFALVFSACTTTAPAADVESDTGAASDAPAAEESAADDTEGTGDTVVESGEMWYDPADVDQAWYHICTDTPPQQGGTLIMSGAPGAVTGNNWFQFAPRDDFLFSQLLDLDVDGETLHPDLATSWEISEDALIYTLQLREGVIFHDGEPFSAEDVKYTLEMFYHPDTGASHARIFGMDSIAGTQAFENGEADEISGIVVVDDYTLEITLDSPRSNFLDGLRGFNIWPKHILEGIPFIELRDSEYAVTNPIGSGPFMMDELEPDQFLTLVAFEDYYAGRPNLDQIIFRIGLIGAPAMAALEAGEIHADGNALGPD
jgi:peptide/nickel transport system substrate-binding protein